MVYIYVLKLLGNKFYVGKTVNPICRIGYHFICKGSKWTQLHRPINIEQIIPNCNDKDENTITIEYMKKKGIENVRGGSFCQINLSHKKIEKINDLIKDKYLYKKHNRLISECF
tara:strand:- start:268 stop:609 length:342 start_codon:yes stop_codon:yes gene_type:complete